MLTTSEKVISCPYCKTEYLPGEIFIPNVFVGQPKEIKKSQDGKILGYTGNVPRYWESYICDKCNKKFYISASITYKCRKPDSTASEEYVQEVPKNEKIYLNEN